jgi:hypothetical protein
VGVKCGLQDGNILAELVNYLTRASVGLGTVLSFGRVSRHASHDQLWDESAGCLRLRANSGECFFLYALR